MSKLSKILLVLCGALLGVGLYVSVSSADFAPILTAALPLGAIAFGLALITRFLHDESAQFDEEYRLRIESARREQRQLSETEAGHVANSRPAHA